MPRKATRAHPDVMRGAPGNSFTLPSSMRTQSGGALLTPPGANGRRAGSVRPGPSGESCSWRRLRTSCRARGYRRA